MLHQKELIFFTMICSTTLCRGLDKLEKTIFQEVKNSNELALFRGTVVAYQTQSAGLREYLYPDNKENISYGYVRKEESMVPCHAWYRLRSYHEKSFVVQVFTKQEQLPVTFTLSESTIQAASLKIRAITRQEKDCICDSLNKRISRFGHGYNEREVRLTLGCPHTT